MMLSPLHSRLREGQVRHSRTGVGMKNFGEGLGCASRPPRPAGTPPAGGRGEKRAQHRP